MEMRSYLEIENGQRGRVFGEEQGGGSFCTQTMPVLNFKIAS
jgi:hypothetical protein